MNRGWWLLLSGWLIIGVAWMVDAAAWVLHWYVLAYPIMALTAVGMLLLVLSIRESRCCDF